MERLIFTKYSTDRDKAFAIRTDRVLDENNNEVIKKIALFDEGINHLQHMVTMSNKLQERYGDKIRVTDSSIEGNVLSNEFVFGKSYYSVFNEIVETKDIERIKEELQHYKAIINYDSAELREFRITPEFEEVFGTNKEIESYGFLSSEVTDIDIIFENIIISESGQWQLIDYEWTFDFLIPQEFVLYRALVFLFQGSRISDLISRDEVFRFMGIPTECEKIFEDMEGCFSKYVTKGRKNLEQEIIESDVKIIPLKDLSARCDFYDEGIWFRDNYLSLRNGYAELKGEYNRVNAECHRVVADYENYRKITDEIVDNYNKLKNLYQIKEYELLQYKNRPLERLKRFLKRFVRKILHK